MVSARNGTISAPLILGARPVVQQNARQFFLENPDIDVYHIWADDIPGGGWCDCSACRGLSTSDQLLLATNTIAEVLAEINSAAEIAFIAYHDTEEPPVQIRPAQNVCLLWAPRTRNYGRAINDDSCQVNSPSYPNALAAQMDALSQAGTTRVFEYYSDAILFKSLLPPMATIMQRDICFYRDMGIHTIQTLMTGDRPWLTAQLANWLFGRLAWQPEQEIETLVADFCRSAFGDAAPAMVAYYAALERAFALVLNQTPDQRQQALFPESPLGIIKHPIADMEDPVHAAAQTLQQRAAEMPRLFALLEQAEAHLHQAQQSGPSPALEAEANAFALTRPWLRFSGHRIKLYASMALREDKTVVRQHWQAAHDAYEQVQGWGETRLASPYNSNFRLLHLGMWGVRLRRIKADQLTSRYWRWWVDLGTMMRIAVTFMTVAWRFRREKKRHL